MLDMEHARFRMLHDSLKKAPLPIKQRWLPTLLYTQACHIINKTIFLFCRVVREGYIPTTPQLSA